ncbi:MAG TPA: O-antigen ligase family protein [Polyangiaceae bacterium]|nr:O-antigen ligase family protein [Polyangiaceae bacterium]
MGTSSDQRSGSRAGRTSTGAKLAGQWVLGACIAGSALAVGTVHTITLCAVTAGLAVACALVWWHAEPSSARSGATLLLFAGIGLTAYTALQTVPVPIAWLAVIAPHNADVWSRALTPLREGGPRWAPISLDPAATRVEVLKGVAYLLAFVTAVRLARQREGARFLGAAVVLTAIALALAAVLHPAFGAHKLFGVYEPGPGIAERHIAPLMNPNNLAAYLGVAVCITLAAALAPEPAVPRAIGAAVVLVLGAAQVWVASRGGVVAMGLGVALVLAITRIGRARDRGRSAVTTLSIVTGAVAAAGALLITLAGSEEASSELFVTDLSKLGLFAHVMRMLPAVPIFGCGRGAFESAYPAFRTDTGHVTYTYPENVVAQWLLEWGVPVGLMGLVAVAYALKPSAVLARSTRAAGAWAALVALAVQNLADIGTEVPGLMLAAVVCAAIVVAGLPGRLPRWRVEKWARAPRLLAACGVVAAAAAIVPAASGLAHELHEDRLALHDAALVQRVSSGDMRTLERGAMLRHPAEPYLPFIAALRASHQRDESPIPWVGATLERARTYAPAHLVLARTLAARVPSQARLEYRLAIEQAPEFDVLVMAEAPRVVGGYYDAMEVVPSGDAPRVLDMLVRALADRLPSTCVRLDAELAGRAPENPAPALRAARGAVEDVEAGDAAPWCSGAARSACLRDALDKTARAQRAAPPACEAHALRARARIAAGEPTAALRDLQVAADSVSDRVACLEALEGIARAAGDAPRANAALDQVVRAGCSDDRDCVRELAWVAARQEATGNPHSAYALYRRAYERAPDDDALLENIARLAAQAGLHAEAAEDYKRLAGHHPGDPRWPAAALHEREAAVREALKL